MEQEGLALHNYLCPFRDTGKLSALIGLPGPPQNGALNDIDVVLIGAQFVFFVLQLRAWNRYLDSESRHILSLQEDLFLGIWSFKKLQNPFDPTRGSGRCQGYPHTVPTQPNPTRDPIQHATNRALTSTVFAQTSFASQWSGLLKSGFCLKKEWRTNLNNNPCLRMTFGKPWFEAGRMSHF